ncbi:MAG TPA: hypothetical protein VN493_05605 [Thermoanaerobaculia bacterium]|nr:hypothetical protein [Thermoanaerobaculia bacterium]
MRRAGEIFLMTLGPDHPSTRGVLLNLELLLEEIAGPSAPSFGIG